jgi:hypothetical protein
MGLSTRKFVSDGGSRRWVALAITTAALGVGLIAQSRSLDPLVFVENDRFHCILATNPGPVRGLQILPREIAAGLYSLDYARRTLVPAMGGSIAVGDFDGDGRLDLYVVLPGGSNSLFRNNGDGTFRDVTTKARVSGPRESISATFSDYDRSGRMSLFVTGARGIVLYHNNGNGTFSDVTRKAGLTSKMGELYTRAVLADIDNDGFPDLLVTIYTKLDRPPSKPIFVFPNDFPGAVSRLYRNNGNGTFTEVTSAAGLDENPGRARNAVIADFNNDGRPDLLILRDDKPPALYLNQGGGKFEDATWDAGDDLTRHAFFDAVVADFNRDGKPDVALWSTMSSQVLLNSGNAAFEQAESIRLLTPLASPFGFHGTVADVDGNGFDDLVTLDNDRRWHFFLNQAGWFQEVLFTLSLGSRSPDDPSRDERGLKEFSSVTPVRLEDQGGLNLLALQPDGRITALRRQDSETK